MTAWVEHRGRYTPLDEINFVTKEDITELVAKVDMLTEQLEELRALVERDS